MKISPNVYQTTSCLLQYSMIWYLLFLGWYSTSKSKKVNVTQGRTGDPTQADIPALSDRPRVSQNNEPGYFWIILGHKVFLWIIFGKKVFLEWKGFHICRYWGVENCILLVNYIFVQKSSMCLKVGCLCGGICLSWRGKIPHGIDFGHYQSG